MKTFIQAPGVHAPGKSSSTAGTAARPHDVDRRELELKFHVPPASVAALRQDILSAGGAVHHHQARYHDTPSGALSRHGVSLRLRQEDGRWIQTVKVSDERGTAGRWEHEVLLRTGAEPGVAPVVDPALHAGTAAGQALQRVLNTHAEPLEERYRTEVERRACVLAAGKARISVTLDQGVLYSGTKRQPIIEMEFELQQGTAQALATVCRTWIERHGVWLAHESKAMQGERLLAGASLAVVKAAPSPVTRHQSGPQVIGAVLRNCLAQILPNAAAVAGGSTNADHVHQLRVGLRRLRTALRELGPLAPHDNLISWEAPLAETFRALGEVRDTQTVVSEMSPRLAAAGVALVPWRRMDVQEDAASAVKHPRFQTALASLLIFAVADDDAHPGPGRPRRWVKKRLKALHGDLRKDGRRFRKLPTEDQHRVRKKLKRLRYLAEFCQPLFDHARTDKYLALMRPAQDALGLHNDYAVALSLLDQAAVARGDPDALLAAHWLNKQLEKSDRKSQKTLRKLQDKAPSFWKRKAR